MCTNTGTIDSLASSLEGKTLEFKRDLSSPRVLLCFLEKIVNRFSPTPGPQRLTPAAEQVTEQVTRLIAVLKTGPLGVREAMNALGLKHRPVFLSNYLQSALKTGLIQMTQPDFPKSPTQKYRMVKTA